MQTQKLNVLISTMNRRSPESLLASMQLERDCVIINQIVNDDIEPVTIYDEVQSIKFLSFREKGLSKSRNRAIEATEADICLIADDDMYYGGNYTKTVLDSFREYPDADIIAFIVKYDSRKNKPILKRGRIGLLNSMKISSVQVAFKKDSVVGKGIQFDEDFGAGAQFYMGEENIFLAECIRKGLRVYYVPEIIAGLRESESSWFKGHDRYNFNVRGRTFMRISPILAIPLIVRFSIVKRASFREEVHPLKALLYMMEGFIRELIRDKKRAKNGS